MGVGGLSEVTLQEADSTVSPQAVLRSPRWSRELLSSSNHSM